MQYNLFTWCFAPLCALEKGWCLEGDTETKNKEIEARDKL